MAVYEADPLVRTLQDMIAIESLSGQEGPLADYVERRLKGAGVAVERDDQDNVVGVLEPLTPGAAARNTLQLSGHLDTVVPVAGWRGKPLDPVVSGQGEDLRVSGLGASDMKGGLAVLLHLAGRLARERPRRLRLVFSFTVCEERAAQGKRNGVHRVLARHPGRWALTTEASCDGEGPTLQLGSQGHLRARIALRGRAAHSATPESGLNAIHAAGVVVARVAELNARFTRRPVVEGVHARPSAAVTVIAGGQAHNIIPECCELHLSRRLAPGETVEGVRSELDALCYGLEGFETAVSLECDGPACVVDTRGPLFLAAQAAARACEGSARCSWNRGRTDLVLFSLAGLDVLNIGPGFMGQAHVAGEFIRAWDLPRVANLLHILCENLDAFLESEPQR